MTIVGVIREIQKAATTQLMAQEGEIIFEFDPSEPLNLGRQLAGGKSM